MIERGDCRFAIQRKCVESNLELGQELAGASETVHVSFPVSELAVTTGDIEAAGRRAVEPGAYQVQVGSATANFSINS